MSDKLREDVARLVTLWECHDLEGNVEAKRLFERIRAALADTVDAPPEVTAEMMEAYEYAHYNARHEYGQRVHGGRGRPYLDAAERAGVIAGLRAALAAAHKEGS